MIKPPKERVLPRGRVATWSREQMDKLSTLDLRALLVNAQRLNEAELAALCTDLLAARRRAQAAARRQKALGAGGSGE
jgi:hypothetical protein